MIPFGICKLSNMSQASISGRVGQLKPLQMNKPNFGSMQIQVDQINIPNGVHEAPGGQLEGDSNQHTQCTQRGLTS